uniref:Uncharacterized protein n=1 Tax=Peronospora matthiolae TaxID=2874970 RepID=A0AAV1U2A6_9STRA
MTRVDGGGCGGGQVSMANPVGVCLRDFSEKCARVCEACLAQLVERKTLNLVVVGSSPTCACVCEACLTQLVERKTLNLVVMGGQDDRSAMTRVDEGGCGGGQVSMASPVGVCLRDFSEKCARVCEACLAQLVERKTLNLVVMGGQDDRSAMTRVDEGGCGGGQKCARVCEACLAQLVERKTLNLVVMGGFEPHACLAQLVERKTLNLVVVGSSPTVGDYQ